MAVITIVVAMAVGGNGGGTPERVQMVIPPDTLEPTVNITATVEAGIQQGLASRVTPTATQMPATAVPTAPPQVTTAPGNTAVPVPAVVLQDDPVKASFYADAKYGGTAKKGGYYDPSHYDLMQVSSVTNSGTTPTTAATP